MTDGTTNIREALACGVAEAVKATAAMGRVMLSVSANGATHERIGPVDSVVQEPGVVRLAGASHDARVNANASLKF